MKKILSTLLSLALAATSLTSVFAVTGDPAIAPHANVNITKVPTSQYEAEMGALPEGKSAYEIAIDLVDIPSDFKYTAKGSKDNDYRLAMFALYLFTGDGDLSEIGDIYNINAIDGWGVENGAENVGKMQWTLHKVAKNPADAKPVDDHLKLSFLATDFSKAFPTTAAEAAYDVSDENGKYKIENIAVYWIMVDDETPVTIKNTRFDVAVATGNLQHPTIWEKINTTINFTTGDSIGSTGIEGVQGKDYDNQNTFYAKDIQADLTNNHEFHITKGEKTRTFSIPFTGDTKFTALVLVRNETGKFDFAVVDTANANAVVDGTAGSVTVE